MAHLGFPTTGGECCILDSLRIVDLPNKNLLIQAQWMLTELDLKLQLLSAVTLKHL